MIATLAQAVALLLIARAVTPTTFAIFSAFFGVAQFIQAIADFGAGAALSRHHQDPARTSSILRLGRVLAALAVVMFTMGAGVYVAVGQDPVVAWCLPLAAWIYFERQSEAVSALLIAQGETLRVSISLLIRRAVVLISICAAITTDRELTMVAVFSLSSLVASLLGFAVLPRQSASFMPHPYRNYSRELETLKLLRPFWLASVGQQLRQLDVAVLSITAGPVVSAIYAPASRLVPPLRMLPTTYAQILLARLSKEASRTPARAFIAPIFVSVLAYAALAATTSVWVPILLGAAYRDSSLVVGLVIVGLPIAVVASLLTSLQQSRDRPSLAASAAWIGGISTLVAIPGLAIFFGAAGAALGSSAGFIFQVLVLLGASLRQPIERRS